MSKQSWDNIKYEHTLLSIKQCNALEDFKKGL